MSAAKADTYQVLIVEDHRELARMLRTAIDGLGEQFVAVDAPSGEEALLEARHRHIDLAIVDWRLPGVDGLEVARRLRERHPKIKIFLISGQPASEVQEAAESIAADAWFRKPLEVADLLDVLERSLGLVESILGDAPKPALDREEEEKVVGRMSDLMADLREALDARAVVLLDEVGHVALQAGSLGESVLPQEALLTLLSLHATGVKLAHIFHSEPYNHFYFHVGDHILHLSTITAQYVLLTVCKAPCDKVSFDELGRKIRATVRGLQVQMERLGIIGPGVKAASTGKGGTEPLVEEEAAGGDPLLNLLEQELPLEEAEAFWDSLDHDDAPGQAINPDVLTYEQARRLGLAPTDD